jgi:chemotaxis protein CheX
MSIVKNILIVSDNVDFIKSLKASLNANYKSNAIHFRDRGDLLSAVMNTTFDATIIDDQIDKKTLGAVIRGASAKSSKKEVGGNIFFLTNDFEKIKGLIESFEKKLKINCISMPASPEEITFQLETQLFPKEYQKQNLENNRYVVDMDFINVFIESTKNVISEMANLNDLSPGSPFIYRKDSNLEVKIRAKIVIDSAFFRGSFFVSFPEETFLSLYTIIVGEEYKTINKENQDFAAELANIIYGKAKVILNGSGVTLNMALPAVDLNPQLNSQDPIISIPFAMEAGIFYIKVAPGLI